MQQKWKDAISSLKKSHLKSHGNPLYVLPWYMIIGMGGSGKTTAIKSARLSSSFTDVQAISGLSGTRNCDWWFFEEAILIDTAGRYTTPVDEKSDREEWHKFLGMLAKYRKKEPLNGLIVTIGVDSLNEMKQDDLHLYGTGVRKRVDEIMIATGARFPVYIMITKCDLIQGMTSFCNSLDDNALQQAMGYINHDPAMGLEDLVSNCYKAVGDNIRDIRLLIIQKNIKTPIDPELLIFPGEFEKTRFGLNAFIKGLFQENPYQESPIFRGIFFSSGMQEGTPYSHFLKDLKLIGENEVLPGTNKGLFLHDFFSKLLPLDRSMFTSTHRAFQLSRFTRHIGFASVVAIVLALCGLLSFSFIKNLDTLNYVGAAFSNPLVFKGETLKDLGTFDTFKDVIETVEDKNRNWWIPRFGLKESINVENQLKLKYCSQFEKRFITPLDKQMADRMAFFSSETPDPVIMNHVIHLVMRINLIKSRLKGEAFSPLHHPPGVFYRMVDVNAGQDIVKEVRVKLKDLYLVYLILQNDKETLNLRMNELQKWLKRILTLTSSDLNWLVLWPDTVSEGKKYDLADFWGAQNKALETVYVPPSFTLNGKSRIDELLDRIEDALVDPLVIAGKKRHFYKWYRENYIQSWCDFMVKFPEGKTMLKTRDNWQNIVERMYREDQMYFSLLNLISKELNPFYDREKSLPWVKAVYNYNTLASQKQAVKIKENGNPSFLNRAVDNVKSKINRATRIETNLDSQIDSDSLLKGGYALMKYHNALEELALSAKSRNKAFKTASLIYTSEDKTDNHPFFKAIDSLQDLKRIISFTTGESEAFWKIVKGPLDFYHDYILRETSCVLQKKWEENVLMAFKDISVKKDTTSLLLGSEGLATLFCKKSGKPFLKRDLEKGFYSKKIAGKKILFHDSFLAFMTKGVATAAPSRNNYDVRITGLPTSVNTTARLKPHATILELKCEKTNTHLENRNYPKSRVFNWSTQETCDVVFKILVGKLTLTRNYKGYYGFPRFLSDFRNGSHTFSVNDFPSHKKALKRMGIEYIKVTYKFKGASAVIRVLHAMPGPVPEEIVSCWE
ncbi:MAG: type VI secretion protein IcmF/TssM N-terminal domain-containing protein [Desulfobacteraceae bacterium]